LEKEPVMYARFVLIAATTLMGAGALAAEPVKAPAQQVAQPHTAQAPVVLASAADVQTPANAQQSPTPPKRHLVRVSSCRCGDQAVDPEAQPEQ
jgi:hypothetical protein